MSPTRHQGFVHAFNKFFDHLTGHHYEGLTEYKLTSFTRNNICRDHEYMLTIPRSVVSYTIESNDPNIENEVVFKNQDIPTIRNMQNHVHDYFARHSLTVNGVIMSFVDMVNMGFSNNDEATGDFTAKVEVCYYKSHIPFEMPLSPQEETKKKITGLERTIYVLQNQLLNKSNEADMNRRLIRRERRLAKEHYSKLFLKMQDKMKGFYKDSGKSEDCPVCYEVIDSAKLSIPGCCHFICTDCSTRCSKCPICREEYI